MSRPLILVGSRGEIRQLAIIAEMNQIEILGILDHHYYGNKVSIGDIPIIGDERWLLDSTNTQAQSWLQECVFFPANYHDGSQAFNGLDLGALRIERIDILERSGAEVINLIHPETKLHALTSKYGNGFKIGRGNMIDDSCVIAVDHVEIGDYCTISIDVKIGHQTKLGRNVIVGPSVFLRHCDIGNNAYMGIYSRISGMYDKKGIIKIGENSTVWASSEVKNHVPDHSIYTNTDRIFKKRSSI